jgi:hypothetical protein
MRELAHHLARASIALLLVLPGIWALCELSGHPATNLWRWVIAVCILAAMAASASSLDARYSRRQLLMMATGVCATLMALLQYDAVKAVVGAMTFWTTLFQSALLPTLLVVLTDAAVDDRSGERGLRLCQDSLWVWGALAGTLILALGSSWSQSGSLILSDAAGADSTLASNYLAFGDSLAMATLLALPALRGRVLPTVGLVSLGLIGTFFISSRSALWALCVAVVPLALITTGRLRWGLFGAALVAVLTVFAAGAISAKLRPVSERAVAVFWGPGADASVNLRNKELRAGLESISERPLSGRFMDEVFITSKRGGYIHNWLSYWTSFGLIPFLLSLTTTVLALGCVVKQRTRFGTASLGLIPLMAFAITSAATARAYIWWYAWLPVAIVFALERRHK